MRLFSLGVHISFGRLIPYISIFLDCVTNSKSCPQSPFRLCHVQSIFHDIKLLFTLWITLNRIFLLIFQYIENTRKTFQHENQKQTDIHMLPPTLSTVATVGWCNTNRKLSDTDSSWHSWQKYFANDWLFFCTDNPLPPMWISFLFKGIGHERQSLQCTAPWATYFGDVELFKRYLFIHIASQSFRITSSVLCTILYNEKFVNRNTQLLFLYSQISRYIVFVLLLYYACRSPSSIFIPMCRSLEVAKEQK